VNDPASRLPARLGAGFAVVALAAIAWIIWRAPKDAPNTAPATGAAATATASVGEPPPSALDATPEVVPTGEPTAIAEPVRPPERGPYVDVSTGGRHACAVAASGTVSCWGDNFEGVLGDGTEASRHVAALVPGIDDATQVSASSLTTCVVRRAGAVACWDRHGAFAAVPDLRDVTELLDGSECALLGSKRVRCWDSFADARVQDIRDVVDASVGLLHTCVVLASGKVKCMGRGINGQLGDGGTDDREEPVDVVGIGDAAKVTTGLFHTCVLRRDGTVACWGEYLNGTGRTAARPEPVEGVRDAVDLVATTDTCALLRSGDVACWGDHHATPTVRLRDVLGISASFGMDHGPETCALRTGGDVACWGRALRFTPVDVPGVRAVRLATGVERTCAQRADGVLVCWGASAVRDGARHEPRDRREPTELAELGAVRDFALSRWRAPTGGDAGLCVVRTSGEVACSAWGWDMFRAVEGVADARQVVVGAAHACALVGAGAVRCWGDGWAGQLGNGKNDRPPVDAPPPPAVTVSGLEDAVTLAAGATFTCALRRAGSVSCWGTDIARPYDDPDRVRNVPTPVADIAGAQQIVAGARHACARLASGAIVCWGSFVRPDKDRLYGVPPPVAATVLEGVGDLAALALAPPDCAVRSDGHAVCWRGDYTPEVLGDGRRGPGLHEVRGLVDATAVSASERHACALRRGGAVACWGQSRHGELGDGSGEAWPTAVGGL
jgi:alpha-tubulin suppressor-like RCC1 family protein